MVESPVGRIEFQALTFNIGDARWAPIRKFADLYTFEPPINPDLDAYITTARRNHCRMLRARVIYTVDPDMHPEKTLGIHEEESITWLMG